MNNMKRRLHHLHQSENHHCFEKSQKLRTLNTVEITELKKIEQREKINKIYKKFHSNLKKENKRKNWKLNRMKQNEEYKKWRFRSMHWLSCELTEFALKSRNSVAVCKSSKLRLCLFLSLFVFFSFLFFYLLLIYVLSFFAPACVVARSLLTVFLFFFSFVSFFFRFLFVSLLSPKIFFSLIFFWTNITFFIGKNKCYVIVILLNLIYKPMLL